MLVLDANILIRAVMGRRVRQLIEHYAARGIRFFAPDAAYKDAEKYLPPILAQKSKGATDVPLALKYLRTFVEQVDAEVYQSYESDAKERLRDRDESDWPILALALALGCSIWTEDNDFFGTGASVWTTNRVEIFLRQRAKAFP